MSRNRVERLVTWLVIVALLMGSALILIASCQMPLRPL